MILPGSMVRQVLAGRKTQARRRATGEGPCRYLPGHDYPLERLKSAEELDAWERTRTASGRARPPRLTVARILVTEVRREQVGAITLQDAMREGFKTTDAFRGHWVSLHDRRWIASQDRELELADLVARFHAHHAPHDVWVIGFELDRTAAPQLLAARSERGYVDRRFDRNGRPIALADEPEAVDAAVQAQLTAQAHERRRTFLADRAAERSLLSLELRLRHARERAARQRIDVGKDLRVIAARIAAIERTLDRPPKP